MEREKLIYMNILKSFVHGTAPDPVPDDVKWGRILELASIHSDIGMVGYVFMTNPAFVSDRELGDFMRKECLRTISVFSQRVELMKLLIQRMNEEGIDHLLFKGYVIRNIYPEPELRTFGDIDFLIRIEDREKCDQIMMDAEFKRGTDWEPVYSYIKGMECYEIHTDVMEIDVSDKTDYTGYFKQIWDHAYLDPSYVSQDGGKGQNHSYLVDSEFHLIYLLTHIAKHIRGSGAGIRMYIDIALYLMRYREEIDWDHFQGELKTLCFEDFVNIVFTAVEQWFDVNSPIPLRPVDQEVMDEFLDYTLEGGTFGHFGRSDGENWLKRTDEDDMENVSKWKTLLHRAFPAAEDLDTRYTYLKTKPWLLPVAWLHRLFLTRDKLGEHAKQAQDIMSADEEKIRKLKRVYKEIGL